MAAPLSPAPNATLNFSTPPTTRRADTYDVVAYTTRSNHREAENDEGDSSPFVNNTKEEDEQENSPPAKLRPTSRIISGTELSPLKILQARPPEQQDGAAAESPELPPPPPPRSPRKMSSPIRRFPVKVSVDETPRAKPPQHERQISIDDVIRQNEGLKLAIDIFEDEISVLENDDKVDPQDSITGRVDVDGAEQDESDETTGPDDTMISQFSTFSAVPNMAMLARLGHSPGKLGGGGGGPTPRAARGAPSPARTPRAGPVPNRTAHYESGNTTNLLMDFTEQLHHAHLQQQQPPSPGRRGGGRLSPSKTAPHVAATPGRQSIVNLLDFDIPPLPTPRSIPTVTPRELESLKSQFLSEISGLKASLSGKEAEAQALQTAVGDAEKRVGEYAEQLREERGRREQLADEKDGWEKRGREMEGVLRKVKEEIVLGQREREELEAKLDEADKRREAAEMMAQEAESKMAGMRAGQQAASSLSAGDATPDRRGGDGGRSPGGTNREVELAVERVARELHGAYKTKHETKVAALKKSYEARWEKRVRELEARADELAEDNERLRVGRDATMTRVVPADPEADRQRKEQAAEAAARIKQLGAEVEKLEAVVRAVQDDNGGLRVLLERERVEKGELVMLAEEMMSMQSFVAAADGGGSVRKAAPAPAATPGRAAAERRMAPAPNGAAGRTSGIKPPVQSRIGRPGHEGKPSSGGLPRPGSGLGMRSGIVSSIEKMGSYRGRAE